ncbi:MAG: VOC family protein [Pseudohongiellaceae bacterium]
MNIGIHINFNGLCEEALIFYSDALGGSIESMTRYEDTAVSSEVPEDFRKKIVHGVVRCNGLEIAGADVPKGYEAPAGIQILVQVSSVSEAEKTFAALSESGSVGFEPQATFWSPYYAMFKDKYGVQWEVNAAA